MGGDRNIGDHRFGHIPGEKRKQPSRPWIAEAHILGDVPANISQSVAREQRCGRCCALGLSFVPANEPLARLRCEGSANFLKAPDTAALTRAAVA